MPTAQEPPEGLDIILVNTPIHDYSSYPRFESTHTPPLGLISLASYLNQRGLSSEVLDAELHQLSPVEVSQILEKARPKFIGLNCFSVNISVTRALLQSFRHLPSEIVLGGPHVTLMRPHDIKRSLPEAQWIIRGDGEVPLYQLLADPQASGNHPAVINLAATPSRDGVISVCAHEQSVLDRNLSRGEPAMRFGLTWYALSLSRGCTFRCTFCAGSSSSNGAPYRRIVQQTLEAELENLRELGASGVRIVDDLPFGNVDGLRTFLRSASQLGLTAQWDVNLPVSLASLQAPEQWEELQALGLSTISFGVEAADEQLRHQLGKRVSTEAIYRLTEALHAAGIGYKTYFILGSPGESRLQACNSLSMARMLTYRTGDHRDGRAAIFAFKPMPGSRTWKKLICEGFTIDQLLDYTDFRLDATYAQKGAWRSKLQFGECTPYEIEAMIDEHYSGSDFVGPDR